MYQSILVAVDGSANSDRAVDVAAKLCEKFSAKLHLVHASELHPLVLGSASVSSMIPEGQLEAMGEEILSAAQSRAQSAGADDIEGHNLLGLEVPALAIVRQGESVDADLIVLGSLGHSNLAGLLIGSVSQKVCQLSKCQCLIVR